MRIVFDSNVLGRATPKSSGPAREVVQQALREPHALVISLPLLVELREMLEYERMRRVHQLDDAEINDFVQGLNDNALAANLPDVVPAVVPNDRDDDLIIATAVAGQADVICTRDKHFRDPAVQSYCTARGIQIMTDVELLAVLRQAGSQPN